MAKARKKDDLFDFPSLDTSGDSFLGMTDPNQGAYDPNLDPSIPGGYDPNLDPNLPPGAYDPRLDPGVPAPGNSYGGGGSSPMDGGSSSLSQIIRAITGSNQGGTGMGALGALLPFLASIYGGIQAHGATQDATHQIQQSLSDANGQITGLLGGAQSNYQPYMDAGKAALTRLQGMTPPNLTGMFHPLGSGRGLNLSQIVKGG